MKRNIPFLLLFFLSLLPGRTVLSQELRFFHITAEQGLSEAVVNCIIEDSKGFMWFGTQDGLNRYDGYGMKVFKNNPDNTNSLSNNNIYSLFEDKSGIIWIGSNGGGLDAFNPKTNSFTHYLGTAGDPGSLSNNNVRAIVEDENGILWLGTEGGLNAFDMKTGKFKRYVHKEGDPQSISDDFIWCIEKDKKGNLWVGTQSGGLNYFDRSTSKFKSYVEYDEKGIIKYLNSNKTRALHLTRDGLLWVGSYGGGLGVFNPNTGKYMGFYCQDEKALNSLSDNRITSIVEDENGVLWIGTFYSGLNEFDRLTNTFINHSHNEKNVNGLNNNDIRSLYYDKEGTIWVGTQIGGVNVHFAASSKFKHYKKAESTDNTFKNNTILALMQDRDEVLWIGTNGGGLSSCDRKRNIYTQYPALSTATNNAVLSLYEDSEGILWVGTWGSGLNSYDKKTGKCTVHSGLSRFNNNGTGTILCIIEDKSGLIWIGTYGAGLLSYDKKTNTFSDYTTADGLGNNNIYGLMEDKEGNLWIGTDGGGLAKRDAKSGAFKLYQKSENKTSLSSNSVYCIHQDKAGTIWAGTQNGLNRMDASGNFNAYYERDGLPNNNIYCILEDKQGHFWMSTNKGVCRFDPLADNTDGKAFHSYDESDGLQGIEFNQGAYFQNKTTGEIFLGGVNGFNTFFPEKITGNTHIPPVYITSFKKFGKESVLDTTISDKHRIELSWKDNFFSFEFVGLDFLMPSKNKYSYKLEGVDEDWSPPSTIRYANYTQVEGGEYIFRVRASNSDGVWNETGAVLHITIIPPFWKTKWFYTLCILVTLGGIFAFVRFRTASIKRENRVLEAKVEERTKELAEKNRDITSSIQYAKRIQEAILPPTEEIFKHFPDAFILYKPKDIVSGDFYWFGMKEGKRIIAAVDCTGHGVPGAFMSMIGHNLFNQIVNENGITSPGKILDSLHQGVQSALKQGTSSIDTSDGMDVVVCSYDPVTNELEYAGAYRPLFVINDQNVEKIDADKFPIGGSKFDMGRNFTNHTRKMNKGDTIYMFSDGYADQFGGDKGKKFMVKRFNDLLLSIQDKPMKDQGPLLDQSIEAWKGAYMQVDDILVIGIRF